MDAGRVMYKKPTIPEEVRAYEPPVDIHELMSDITLSRLHEIFESIMKKQQDKIDPLRSKFGKIEKEEVSLEDKMEDLKKYAAGHRHFSFRGLFDGTVIESGSDRYVSCDSGADENGNDTDFAGTYF